MIYVWRYSLVAIYTVFWGSLGMLLFIFVREGRAVPWVVRNWTKWIMASCGIRYRVEGAEGVRDAAPCVIMSNHQSVFDIAVLANTLPVSWKFVAKRELLRIPFFGWAMALGDQIMIDRSNHERSVESLAVAARRVAGGVNVIIFPEGTRQPGPGVGDLKSGGFHLAMQAGVPIQPVSISGSRRITPRGSLRIERGEILIRYGKPIPTKGLAEGDRDALKQRVADAIEAGIDFTRQG